MAAQANEDPADKRSMSGCEMRLPERNAVGVQVQAKSFFARQTDVLGKRGMDGGFAAGEAEFFDAVCFDEPLQVFPDFIVAHAVLHCSVSRAAVRAERITGIIRFDFQGSEF